MRERTTPRASTQAKRTHRAARARLAAWLLAGLVGAGTAGAQTSNQIQSVSPANAAAGTSNLLVTFTLDTDTPPPPPAGILPTSVTIGTLTGGSITHASQATVTAVFSIPAGTTTGAKDCTVVFPSPMGTLTFSLAGGFTVTTAATAAPQIVQQPLSRTVRLGAATTFSVVATGYPAPTYRWQKDQVDIPQATSASYTISAVAAEDAGSYRCIAENALDSATSDEATLTVDTSPPTAANSSLVPDTRQELCYNATASVACPAPGAAFHGQDAQHAGYPPAFTVSADGVTVTDATTGLTWQRTPDLDGDGVLDASDKLTWSQAQLRPAALNAALHGGYSDWRLPTLHELYSLIDFRGTDPSGLSGNDTSALTPFIDRDYFSFAYGDTAAGERIIDSQYASSTLYVADGNKLFGVNFADGRIKGYDLTMPDGSQKTFFVLCVRGNPGYGASILVVNGDGTVTDRASDRMWSQTDSGVAMSWEAALAWVAARNAESWLGHSDWRLPEVKELQSILDTGRSPDTSGGAALDPRFAYTAITNEGGVADAPYYWSSTTHATWDGSGGAAAYVAFGRGLGWMQVGGASCYTLVDVHGAGTQRSDPKTGSVSSYYLGTACSGGSAYGHGPQGDILRIANFVRLVRGGNGPLAADFVFTPTTPDASSPVAFDATASGALSPYTYAWDLGGVAASGASVARTLSVGTHSIELTVTDAAGFHLVVTHAVTVVGTAPVLFADAFENGSVGRWSSFGGAR